MKHQHKMFKFSSLFSHLHIWNLIPESSPSSVWLQCGAGWQPSLWWETDDSDGPLLAAERFPQVSDTRGAAQRARLHPDSRRGAAGNAEMFYCCFSSRSLILQSFDLFMSAMYSQLNTHPESSIWVLFLWLSTLYFCFLSFPSYSFFVTQLHSPCLSGGEGAGCAVWAPKEQPASGAGADCAPGVGRGAAV